MLNKHIHEAYNNLLRLVEETPVLLLHPYSKYRSILVAMLISDENVPAYYYALGPDDINLRTFVEGLTHNMASQHPTFGRHINLLPQEVFNDMSNSENMQIVLEKLVQELTELTDDTFILILDEYDRSDSADDIHLFLEYLADAMPPQCRLILNSRTLPRLPWVAMIAKQQASLLLDSMLIEEDFYGTKRDGKYDLEIYALGPGNVVFDGTKIDSWEGHLPRLLFFFVLDKPIVTRAEICNAFWPNLPIDQGVNVFHVTKRRLHKALGADVLVHQDSHYQVNPQFNVYVDILDFVETLMRGRNPNTKNPFEVYQHAVELYQGPFLQGHSEDWIHQRRNAFRAGYLEAMSAMAQMWIGKDRKELALKLYRQALEEDFYREDIHREILKLYNDLGRRSEAIVHYQNLQRVYGDEKRSLSTVTITTYNDIAN